MTKPARLAQPTQEREVVLGQGLRATILTTAPETDGRHDLTVAVTPPGDQTPHAVKTGPDGARALLISSPAGFAELLARTGTPVRLATPQTEFNEELFMSVTTELGDVVLGPPGTTPGEQLPATGEGR